MQTWLRRTLLALPLIIASSPRLARNRPYGSRSTPRPATAVQLSIDAALRQMTDRKVPGSLRELLDPSACRRSGADLVRRCRRIGRVPIAGVALTSPGSRVVLLCAKRYRETFATHRALVEVIIIHQILHVYGLRENPPSGRPGRSLVL
jgi:hypothetical protein